MNAGQKRNMNILHKYELVSDQCAVFKHIPNIVIKYFIFVFAVRSRYDCLTIDNIKAVPCITLFAPPSGGINGTMNKASLSQSESNELFKLLIPH